MTGYLLIIVMGTLLGGYACTSHAALPREGRPESAQFNEVARGSFLLSGGERWPYWVWVGPANSGAAFTDVAERLSSEGWTIIHQDATMLFSRRGHVCVSYEDFTPGRFLREHILTEDPSVADKVRGEGMVVTAAMDESCDVN